MAFLNNKQLKTSGLHRESNPGPFCLTHKRYSPELGQSSRKQTLQICIYAIKGYIFFLIIAIGVIKG